MRTGRNLLKQFGAINHSAGRRTGASFSLDESARAGVSLGFVYLAVALYA
jgi:hypothetical protein